MISALALLLGLAPQEFRYHVFQESVELGTLLRACAREVGMPIDYDPAALQGPIAIDAPDGLGFEGLWTLTNRRLLDRGLACIQLPGQDALAVVKTDQASGLARIEYGSLDAARAGYVKTLYAAQHTGPSELEVALRGLLPTDGSVASAISGSGHLLISGLKPQVIEVLASLGILDSGPASVVVEEIEVRHVSPTALAAQLEQLSQKRAAAGGVDLKGSVVANPAKGSLILVAPVGEAQLWRDWAERFDRADALLTRGYVPSRFGLEETAKLVEELVTRDGAPPPGWRAIRDELTGTLIVTAPYAAHEEIDALMTRLDAVDASARRALRSFAIRYRDVEELVDLLGGLVEEERGIPEVIGEATAEGEPIRPPPPRVIESSESGGITLTADKDTNRILAYGEVHLLTQLESLITTLDVAHPQVLVEVLVVALTENEVRDLGVELRYGGESGGVQGEVASLFNLGAPAIQSPLLLPLEGSGGSGVILDPGSFSALVRALESVNDGRVQTMPKVLVSNHKDATLNSVLQEPYLSTSSTTAVATTSLGGTSDAGTSVTVTPHILDGDRLLLEYDVSLSTFTGASTDPALPPPRQENLLQSTATIPDGYTIAVGGLDFETELSATTRVPVLGSIPGFGWLFRSTSKSTSKTRFFVFLRCTVLRGAKFDELRYLSGRERDAADVPDDFPALQPRIIR